MMDRPAFYKGHLIPQDNLSVVDLQKTPRLGPGPMAVDH